MPVYCYQCKTCENYFEESHKIDEREEPLKTPCAKCNEGELQIVMPSGTSVIDPYRIGRHKPNDGFRDRLREIKKTHPKGNVNTW